MSIDPVNHAMGATLTTNQITALVVGAIGLASVGYPLVLGPIEIWSIGIVMIGGLLLVAAVVIFVSGQPPRERDLQHRGGV